MARRKIKKRLGSKKVAGKRRSVKAPRFDTEVVRHVHTPSMDARKQEPRIRIFDRKVKKYIKGEWEISHALAVLNHLIDNPDSATRFGYAK